MDLYKKAIDETELSIRVFVLDAHIWPPPNIPLKISELRNTTGKEIMEILWLGAMWLILSPNWWIISWVVVYSILKVLYEVADFKDKEEVLTLEALSGFYGNIHTLAVPIIKKCADDILYTARDKRYIDDEVSLAMNELKSFFYQNNWEAHFQLAIIEYPYMKEWLEYPED